MGEEGAEAFPDFETDRARVRCTVLDFLDHTIQRMAISAAQKPPRLCMGEQAPAQRSNKQCQ